MLRLTTTSRSIATPVRRASVYSRTSFFHTTKSQRSDKNNDKSLYDVLLAEATEAPFVKTKGRLRSDAQFFKTVINKEPQVLPGAESHIEPSTTTTASIHKTRQKKAKSNTLSLGIEPSSIDPPPKKTRNRKSKPKTPKDTKWTRPSIIPSDAPAKVITERDSLLEIQDHISSNRVPLSLLENPWEDVTRYLRRAYNASKGLGDNRRIHVISQSLCDDALQRLEPSLEQHVGCDIVDINPGTCLWSRTLHKRLQPRKHILMEPDEKMYRPFLQPLLSNPDSKYTLVNKSGIVWSHLQTVLSKHHLPQQEALKLGDPRLEEKNNTLLVVANLGYHPMKPYRGFDSLASLVIYQFMSATRTHSLFERYGRVRFIVWTNDDEKRHLLPREIHLRRKTAIEAEVTFETLNEIASTTVDTAAATRDKAYDEAMLQRVLERMKAAHISTPAGRESVLLQKSLSPTPHEEDPNELWSMSRKALEQIQIYEEAIESGELQAQVEVNGVMQANPEYKKYRTLCVNRNFIRKRIEILANLLQEHDRLAALQKEIYALKQTGNDTDQLEQTFSEEKQKWREEIELMPDNYTERLRYMIDNHRTTKLDPPLLAYDRRSFEPLLVNPTEFFPPQPMCLLDFHPGTPWPILSHEKAANRDIFEFVVGSFFHLPTQSVKRALKSLWPGAYEWIIEQCPSLTDPNRGGALDLDSLTVRTLTEDMLKEIITAWTKWPFKPTRYELLGRMGGAGHDPENEFA